jgi:hypothetical protein
LLKLQSSFSLLAISHWPLAFRVLLTGSVARLWGLS